MTAMDKENFLLCVCMCMRNRRDSVLLHCLFLNLRLYRDRWDVFHVNVKPLNDTFFLLREPLQVYICYQMCCGFHRHRLRDESSCVYPPKNTLHCISVIKAEAIGSLVASIHLR